MANTELHRGRLIDHVQLAVRDLEASKRFYKTVFQTLEIPIVDGPDFFWADEVFISTATSKAAAGRTTGPTHLAFQAKDRATVDRWYAAAVDAGGKDNGAPGERAHYHPGYYAAYVLDPDGNNIEFVHHGAAQRSAASVRISF
jgi:catechol 2,3-dioxygenase-like lactoylglutathione lyase family enzyme